MDLSRWSHLSVSAFFARHAWEGRAVLLGNREHPVVWLCRFTSNTGARVFAACCRNVDDLVFYRPTAQVRELDGLIRRESSRIGWGEAWEPDRPTRRRFFGRGSRRRDT